MHAKEVYMYTHMHEDSLQGLSMLCTDSCMHAKKWQTEVCSSAYSADADLYKLHECIRMHVRKVCMYTHVRKTHLGVLPCNA